MRQAGLAICAPVILSISICGHCSSLCRNDISAMLHIEWYGYQKQKNLPPSDGGGMNDQFVLQPAA